MDNFTKDVEIKLVALDMDGTLFNDKQQISDENRRAIKEIQEKGIFVVLSTGRSILTCGQHADSLELTSYLVTVNGSEIWDGKRVLVQRNLLKPDLIQWMWELSRQHKTRFWAVSTDKLWHNDMPEDIHQLEWLKFGFDIENDDVRTAILQKLKEKGEFELSNSTLRNIEVNPIGINKANGLKIVCNRLGIDMKNVMAMGDSLNDIAMITEAGLGIAMGNAQEAVKKAADWVTLTNNEHGVAYALKKWILDK